MVKILTFIIYQINFITFNTLFFNTSNIKTSIFLFIILLKYCLFIIFYSFLFSSPNHPKPAQSLHKLMAQPTDLNPQHHPWHTNLQHTAHQPTFSSHSLSSHN